MDWFCVNVLPKSDSEPLLAMPPPFDSAKLLEIVQSVTVKLPLLLIPPPIVALPPEIVSPVRLAVTPEFTTNTLPL